MTSLSTQLSLYLCPILTLSPQSLDSPPQPKFFESFLFPYWNGVLHNGHAFLYQKLNLWLDWNLAHNSLLYENLLRSLLDDEEAAPEVDMKDADISAIVSKSKEKKEKVSGKALNPK